MKVQISLHCIAPDGEYVTEGREFLTVEAAWERNNEMGSRWVFYPIPVVTSSGKAGIIRDVPHGIDRRWVGRKLATFVRAISQNQKAVEAYLEGQSPLFL